MHRVSALLVTAAVVSLPFVLVAQQPDVPAPSKEHAWLQQFVGEWDVVSEATMAPGQPPIKATGTMTTRQVGGLWIVNEMKVEMMGTTSIGLQTIGYDPAKKKYVGTWVDSMMNHLWIYEGTVDAAGTTVTLEAQGPNLMDGGKMTTYRDAYAFKSADHIVATSSMLGDDGKWVTFMTGEMRRKK